VLGVLGCDAQGPLRTTDTPETSRPVSPRAHVSAVAVATTSAPSCEERIRTLSNLPGLPLAPAFERQRAAFLMRAKAEPIFFLREPKVTLVSSKGMAAQQRRLVGPYAREATNELVRSFRGRPDELKQLFLRESYLYTSDPSVARELNANLDVADLFIEPELTLLRGGEELHLVREKAKYVYKNGSASGQRAQLLLFDRIWVTGHDPGPSLHVELREALSRGSMSQIQPLHVTESGLVARVRYDSEWVTAVFRVDAPRLELECETATPRVLERLGRAKDRAYRQARVVRQLRRAVVQEVEAGLPFDEPKTEVGQQDGELRQRWEDAYFGGAERYRFNSDTYNVFDARGQPLTPQVCVDFVTETIERASGMHYARRGQKPEKIRGLLDFDALLSGERRREHALRGYARAHPEQLQILDYPMDEVVKYEQEGAFLKFLIEHEQDFDAGDIVIIRGRAAWDHYEAIHSHAFFVYETDPVTGVPILLAGNSGKPRIVTWDAEMQRAPKRGIYHRIRPNMEWLYDQVVLLEPASDERWAAPLSVFQGG
jgi:hypothetical protein